MIEKQARFLLRCATVIMVLVFGLVICNQNVFAATCNGVETNLIGCEGDSNGGIFFILLLVLDILFAGVGILGVISIAVAGISYLTAGNRIEQAQHAKKRIFQIVVGIACLQ